MGKRAPAGVCVSRRVLIFLALRSCFRPSCGPVSLLVGGEELRHVVQCDLVHVACGVEVVLAVVEGAVRFFAFGVCAVPLLFTRCRCGGYFRG